MFTFNLKQSRKIFNSLGNIESRKMKFTPFVSGKTACRPWKYRENRAKIERAMQEKPMYHFFWTRCTMICIIYTCIYEYYIYLCVGSQTIALPIHVYFKCRPMLCIYNVYTLYIDWTTFRKNFSFLITKWNLNQRQSKNRRLKLWNI